MGLEFSPLHWVWHDCWKWRETMPPPYPPQYDSEGNIVPHWVEYLHSGHVHFFFNGKNFDTTSSASRQAYWGEQKFSFSIADEWGPGAPAGAGRTYSMKLVGKPRWYFYVEEYWRRVFVQNWDVVDNSNRVNHPRRSGIKYDACKEAHRCGPFREGGGFFFYYPRVNRGLPIEYWLDASKKVRDCWVKHGDVDASGNESSSDVTTGGYVWNGNLSQELPSWAGWIDGVPNRYQSSYAGAKGFRTGDYCVVYSEGYNIHRVFQYTYEPYVDDAWEEKFGGYYYNNTYDYWPNPNPTSVGAALRRDYLEYFYQWDNFLNYCNKMGIDSGDENSFRGFLSSIHTSLVSSYPFYVSFDDYASIWQELSDDEIYSRGLQGDLPASTGKTVPYGEDGDFGSGDNPFHKDGSEVNPYDVYLKYFNRREIFTIPRGSIARGDRESSSHPRSTSFSDEDGARWHYPDSLFITPVIEYQRVVQIGSNDGGEIGYERLPERLSAEKDINIYTDASGAFGDGFDVEITIPYRRGGKIQSPFSDDDKQVYPPGNYFHDVVKEEDKLRYNTRLYQSLDDVKVFQNHKWQEQLLLLDKDEQSLDEDDKMHLDNWFESTWLGRPLCRNSEEEGRFYYGEDNWMAEGIWVEPMTTCLPDLDKFATVTEDGVTRYGYYDSKGNFVAGGGRVVEFDIPANLPLDGVWVEQCLGAIVKAKVELVFEDAFGHRTVEWVDITEAHSEDSFVGLPTIGDNDGSEW